MGWVHFFFLNVCCFICNAVFLFFSGVTWGMGKILFFGFFFNSYRLVGCGEQEVGQAGKESDQGNMLKSDRGRSLSQGWMEVGRWLWADFEKVSMICR